jgi:hypothetical protein
MDCLPPFQHCKAPPPLDMRKQNLTSEERRSIVSRLPLSVQPDNPDFKLRYGIITSTTSCFHVSRITFRKVRQCALANFWNPTIHIPKIKVKPAVKRHSCLAASCCSRFGNDAFTSICISYPPRCRSFKKLCNRVVYFMIIPPKLAYQKSTAMPRRSSHTTIYMQVTERHSENVFFAKRQDTFLWDGGSTKFEFQRHNCILHFYIVQSSKACAPKTMCCAAIMSQKSSTTAISLLLQYSNCSFPLQCCCQTFLCSPVITGSAWTFIWDAKYYLCAKIWPFLARMYDLFYCTNLNKKGSATVVWIIFTKVYFNKKLRFMQNFCFVLCYLWGC